MDRILNVLVRFYDEDAGSVKTQHLASKKVNIANASALMLELNDVLHSYGLEWRQVTSMLLDNCAVMRGKKSGLETLARKENPNLLDISGDTVHMVSNAAKALMSPFQSEVEDFCSDVYYDIEKSPKQKEIFAQFQSLLHLTPKSLIRPISNRFIQMLEVCSRMNELLDVLVVHYYHVMDANEEHKYRRLLNQVFERHDLTTEEKARIVVLQKEQAAASRTGTQVNQDRKDRISVVISEFERVKVMIDLYRGIFCMTRQTKCNLKCCIC
ncbi:hypothetical protein ABG768_022345 [Culter alburnus]|uniref:DUF4371 domain-containing protein n=1 Tax=Culter alburnus TaxID=194366 RepID=A0AAW2AIF7_CULAL